MLSFLLIFFSGSAKEVKRVEVALNGVSRSQASKNREPRYYCTLLEVIKNNYRSVWMNKRKRNMSFEVYETFQISLLEILIHLQMSAIILTHTWCYFVGKCINAWKNKITLNLKYELIGR